MSANKSPMGFLVGALMLGVFWGLLSQWGEKSVEEKSETLPSQEPVITAPKYELNPAQTLAQSWLAQSEAKTITIKSMTRTKTNLIGV